MKIHFDKVHLFSQERLFSFSTTNRGCTILTQYIISEAYESSIQS